MIDGTFTFGLSKVYRNVLTNVAKYTDVAVTKYTITKIKKYRRIADAYN